MDFSVIIPTYNDAILLDTILNELMTQTGKLIFEVIVVDDGSNITNKQKLHAIIAKKSHFLKISLLETKHGLQGNARMQGLKHAQGKFVVFLDADDEISNNLLCQYRKHFYGHDVIACGIRKMFLYSKPVLEWPTSFRPETEDRLGYYLARGNESDNGLWNKAYRRSFLNDHQIQIESGNFFEDSLFNFKVLGFVDSDRLAFLDDANYILKKRRGSTTNNKDNLISLVQSIKQYEKRIVGFMSQNSFVLPRGTIVALRLRNEIFLKNRIISWSSNLHEFHQLSNLTSGSRVCPLNLAIRLLPNKYRIASIIITISPSIYFLLAKPLFR